MPEVRASFAFLLVLFPADLLVGVTNKIACMWGKRPQERHAQPA
jgi:hypothetical protein